MQTMHIGPYASEPATVERMKAFATENGYRDRVGSGGKHHEIYMGDPRRAKPEKLKTILRHPIEKPSEYDGKTASLHLSTRGNADILDVTEQIRRTVAESGVKNGAVTVFTPSSTSALTTIEYEGGALNDLRRLFDEIIPVDQIMPIMPAGTTGTVTAIFAPPCWEPR